MHAHDCRPIRKVSYLLTWLILAIIVVGCNRGEPTPTPAPTQTPSGIAGVFSPPQATDAPPPATVEATVAPTPTPLAGRVVLWHSWAQAEGDALAAILALLKEQYPGLQVDTLFVAPNDLVSSYAEAVNAGSGPDLVLAPNWWLSDLATSNAILNLDPLVGGNLDATYWPAAVQSMRHNNSLYGFPITHHLVALYVNRSLVPPEGIPPTTGDLLAAAQLTATSGIGIYATLFHSYWGFPAYGAQLLDAQGVATLDQGSGAAEYLTWLKTLNTTPGSYVNSDYGMLLDRFKKGEFAYFIDGPWALTDLRNALGDNLLIATLPAGPAGPARPWLYSDGLFVNPTISPEQQTLALNVGLFMSGDRAGTTLASVGGLLPAARNADLSSTPLLQGFAAQAQGAEAMPVSQEMNQVWAYGADMIIKALTGVAETPAIVAETTTLINEANGK